MVSSDKILANVVGGKSARACDNCIKKRARWYCTADDAFLCQSCDLHVHSANPLARRHERVRLKTGSIINEPSWTQGYTRKPRTPRNKKNCYNTASNNNNNNNPVRLVPEICSEENSHEDEEHSLLYRVPIFFDELCTSSKGGFSQDQIGFLPSEMDLAEFAADVESLLGKGLDDKCFDMEGLGLLNCDDGDDDDDDDDGDEKGNCNLRSERVKVEDEFVDLGRENLEMNFDYDSSPIMNCNQVCDDRKIFLRLDYEGVLSAWDDQKSPWTTGERPDLDSGECWPHYVGTSGGAMHLYGDIGMMMGGHVAAMGDGGREARVSRYREKRRTRLFSKKIRYEVRKLNAEKRPRMKGRFVKRSNFVTPTAANAAAAVFAMNNK